MSLNVLTLPINLYINCVVMLVEVDSNACSVYYISYARGDLFARYPIPSNSMLEVVELEVMPNLLAY